MYISETYGKLELSQIPEKINDYFQKMKQYGEPIHIVVGSDSQNFSDTKLVNVVAVYCEGHGGIYFYEISRINKIKDVRVKLHVETGESLKIATELVDLLEQYEELYLNTTLSIHVDAGLSPKGKTRELIPELVGWIKGTNPLFEVKTKPDSWVASTIADKITK